jgi:hypothetical protein
MIKIFRPKRKQPLEKRGITYIPDNEGNIIVIDRGGLSNDEVTKAVRAIREEISKRAFRD